MSDPPGVHAPGLKWALNGRIRVLRPLDEQHSELGVSPLQVSSPGIFRHARQRRRRFPTPQSSAAESSLCGRSMTSPTSRRGLTKLSQPGGVVLVGVQIFARSAAHVGTEQQTQRIPDRPVHVLRVYRLVRDVRPRPISSSLARQASFRERNQPICGLGPGGKGHAWSLPRPSLECARTPHDARVTGRLLCVAISIQVRTEWGVLIASLDDVAHSLTDDPDPLLAGELPHDRHRFPMVGHVDPVGNTIFNRRQTAAVLEELQLLAREDRHKTSWAARARAVEILVAAHMRRPHTYLWFVGD